MTVADQIAHSTSPLDQPAGRAVLEQLAAAGYLSPEAADEAATYMRPSGAWWQWASRMMLFLGSAMALAGVVFFFAHNWARMEAYMKFGVIGPGMLICLVGAYLVGLDRIVSKILLLSAALLVGVLLAVYGQTYQTGADPYELFAGWAVLILAWVAISKFAALWLLWLVLINVALVLYWQQVVIPNSDYTAGYSGMFVLLGLINGLGLICREYAAGRGASWLQSRWLRWVLVLSVLIYLTIPTMVLIIDDRYDELMSVLAGIMLVASVVGAYRFFRFRAKDLLPLTLCALSGCVVIITLIGRGLFELSTAAGMYLLFGLLVLGVFSAATFWLQLAARAMGTKNVA